MRKINVLDLHGNCIDAGQLNILEAFLMPIDPEIINLLSKALPHLEIDPNAQRSPEWHTLMEKREEFLVESQVKKLPIGTPLIDQFEAWKHLIEGCIAEDISEFIKTYLPDGFQLFDCGAIIETGIRAGSPDGVMLNAKTGEIIFVEIKRITLKSEHTTAIHKDLTHKVDIAIRQLVKLKDMANSDGTIRCKKCFIFCAIWKIK